ncbi:transferrin-a [Paramisgurnus dabryanus]|uniref:transferrin-a n=1 Tax=Paramisgurnus dabryanus TaxID=90735 RepID=UPI0031F3D4D4
MNLLLTSLLGCLVLALPLASGEKIKWCVTSQPELNKCNKLATKAPELECFLQKDVTECMTSIKTGAADAITVGGYHVFQGGLTNYELHPIIEEKYKKGQETCYAVAVVKKDTAFTIKDLSGKTSCHDCYKSRGGWFIPIGKLISERVIPWDGSEEKSLEKAVSEFFSASCVPGISKANYPNLCKGCKSDCSCPPKESDEPFACLKSDAGQVAFICHNKIPSAEKQDYKLLCMDGSSKSVDEYKDCHLGKVVGHAVISRKDASLSDQIFKVLSQIPSADLFSSDGGKDLMFSDSATGLIKLPEITDSFFFLKNEYEIMLALKDGPKPIPPSPRPVVNWCTIGHGEKAKCDDLSGKISRLSCQSAPSVNDCIVKIKRGEFDAIAVDGGQVWAAEKCGLVAAMAEQYNQANCEINDAEASSYYAVAVVKKGSGVTWNNLKGKKSCHTGLNRNAGWNIPQTVLCREKNECDMYTFFNKGCAPGADPKSNMCELCKGSGKTVGDASKCKTNPDEQYYGYDGAFRCLAEGPGEVAFIKHSIVSSNTDGNGPDWAKNLKSEDFELICPTSPFKAGISDYEKCNWALVPAHAVITREDVRNDVVTMLKDAQTVPDNNLFKSLGGKNLIFSDSTKCLQEIKDSKKFLGDVYKATLDQSKPIPELVQACTLDNYPVEV